MQEVKRILKRVIKELNLPVKVEEFTDEYGMELVLNGQVGIRKEKEYYCIFAIPILSHFDKRETTYRRIAIELALESWFKRIVKQELLKAQAISEMTF